MINILLKEVNLFRALSILLLDSYSYSYSNDDDDDDDDDHDATQLASILCYRSGTVKDMEPFRRSIDRLVQKQHCNTNDPNTTGHKNKLHRQHTNKTR